IGTTAGFELRTARTELRAALGTRSGAAPDDVIRALVAAQSAISRNDRAAAAAALSPALFEPGGTVTLARLVAPGPLPQARLATTIAREGVERLEADRAGGLGAFLDPGAGFGPPQPMGGLR
ncbi:MAG TPA: hypothetical protein VE033_18155, partial [Acetobacteraceae bacterium]|nr:hypothetical protein [Acetobacteraceae bacterium]